MPRRANILNVREHLKHVQLVIDGLAKYGMCPAIEREIQKLALINKAILHKAESKRAAGNRHDLYIPVEN